MHCIYYKVSFFASLGITCSWFEYALQELEGFLSNVMWK